MTYTDFLKFAVQKTEEKANAEFHAFSSVNHASIEAMMADFDAIEARRDFTISCLVNMAIGWTLPEYVIYAVFHNYKSIVDSNIGLYEDYYTEGRLYR